MAEKRVADEDVISSMIVDELESRSSRIAGLMGPPPGTESVSGQQEEDLWNETKPDVDIMTEYQKAIAQGMSDENARSAATVAKYPNRGPMLLCAAADDAGKVKYAQEMKRRTERRLQKQETGAEPVMPVPVADSRQPIAESTPEAPDALPRPY